MKNEFLLTYSVKSMGKKNSDKDSDNVRRYIDTYLLYEHDIDNIEKLDSVETTITGMITVTGSTDNDKKNHIKKTIRGAFDALMNTYNIEDTSIEIHCAILVQGIKKTIVFEV